MPHLTRPSASQHNTMRALLRRVDSVGLGYQDNLGFMIRSQQQRRRRVELVKVSNDGGAAGSDAANCTYTYTISNLADVEQATGLTPQMARYPLTAYLAAAAGGRSEYGLAAFVQGSWILLIAYGEIADTSTCP